MDYLLIVSQMTASQFKAFKKALNVLMRAGMNRQDAMELLISAIHNHKRYDVRRAS